MSLTPYRPGRIWLCAYPTRRMGTRFDARKTVIRLGSGALLLHSPCAITPALRDEIAALGPVAHIVAPGSFHHLHVPSAQAALPEARTWLCPGVEAKRPELRHDGLLGDIPPEAWAGEIDQALVQGSRIIREVAMVHRASATLILVDLIENFTDSTPRANWLLKLWFKAVFRRWNRPKPAPEYRIGWCDGPAAAETLRRILAWPFERIVLAQGDLIETDAHTVAAAAWAPVLASRASGGSVTGE